MILDARTLHCPQASDAADLDGTDS